jgi:hypothetical protein
MASSLQYTFDSEDGAMGNLPANLVKAIEQGQPITEEQLRELITVEAKEIGLSFDEAVKAAQKGALPSGSLFASDIAFLVDLLPHAA